jgi:hypothetical protein
MASWEVIAGQIIIRESDGSGTARNTLPAGTKYMELHNNDSDAITEGFYHPETFTVSFDFYIPTNGNLQFTFLSANRDMDILTADSHSLCVFFHQTNNRIFFRRWTGGAQTYVLTMTGAWDFNAWQTCRIERDLDGTYRFYVDNDLKGTSSDTVIQDADFMCFGGSVDDVDIANIKITRGVEA